MHPHDEPDDCAVEVYDSKHAKYIAKHLKKLREQCNGFNHCLDELYSKENTLLILQGKDIELRHVCSLVSPNEEEEEEFACSKEERTMIREDLRTHLDEMIGEDDDVDHIHARGLRRRRSNGRDDHTQSPEIKTTQANFRNDKTSKWDSVLNKLNITKTSVSPVQDQNNDGQDQDNDGQDGKARLDPDEKTVKEWQDLGTCIEGKFSGLGSVATVCNLQRNATSHLCRSADIHHAVEKFFNKQLRHLQCTCDALPKDKVPLPFIAGGGAGGFVLLCSLVILCCCISRSKKKNKKKKHGGENGTVSYHVSEKEENASFYSEISDLTMPLKDYRREMTKQTEGMSNKPDLPTRYAKVPKNPSTKELAGSIEYLEPWDSPRFSLAEVDYDAGQSNSPDVPPENPNRGSYFAPLGDSTPDHEDCGYETLTRKNKNKVKSEAEAAANETNDGPVYFVLENKQ